MDGASGQDHGSSAYGEFVGLPCRTVHSANHTGRSTALRDHSAHVAVHHHPGSGGRSVFQVRAIRRVLRSVTAPIAAKTALQALKAVSHIPRHHIHVPPQGVAAPLQQLIPHPRSGPTRTHVQPSVHSLQGLGEPRTGEQAQARVPIPLRARPLRQRQARGVVDDRSPTQAASGENRHRAALSHEQPAVQVERTQHVPFDLGHVPRACVGPPLQHYYAATRLGEHTRYHPPSRP